jgi:hypothetical protein
MLRVLCTTQQFVFQLDSAKTPCLTAAPKMYVTLGPPLNFKSTRRKQRMVTAHKQATLHLAKQEQKPDPLKEAPALQRQIDKALAMHHGALTAQIEAVMAAWELLQQQVAADMSWRELEMQVGRGFGVAGGGRV